ncbi:MAG: YdcF family protein [Alphaproteobacteria bacterium]|nr:YdcF family protein [Alphaproteobacteria bacterium]
MLTAIGVALAWRWTRLGLVIATFGGALLYLASMPVVAGHLVGTVKDLAQAIPILPSDAPPGAIIVLSADYRRSDPPNQSYTVGPLTLERLAEAAREERRLGLPVLVSGGRPEGVEESLAEMMSTVLQDDFRVPVRWREDRSLNTFENAAFSADILRRAGVPSALLITHCRDMARALWSFHAVGYPVIPAICSRQQGTGPGRSNDDEPLFASDFFPQVPALLVSYRALHELIGLAWYQYRYRDGKADLSAAGP